MSDPDVDDIKRRMQGAVDVLKTEFGGLRTGRASSALLEPVTVEVGFFLNNFEGLNTMARTLSLFVWFRLWWYGWSNLFCMC